jgi:alcohol dehydrogenase (NADP+)
MERLHDRASRGHIGMSSMTIPKLEAVLPLCRVKPSLIEMELHPCFQQQELYDYCGRPRHSAYRVLPHRQPDAPGSGHNPRRRGGYRGADGGKDRQSPPRPPRVICLKWAVQRGQIPIPISIHENNTFPTCNARPSTRSRTPKWPR